MKKKIVVSPLPPPSILSLKCNNFYQLDVSIFILFYMYKQAWTHRPSPFLVLKNETTVYTLFCSPFLLTNMSWTFFWVSVIDLIHWKIPAKYSVKWMYLHLVMDIMLFSFLCHYIQCCFTFYIYFYRIYSLQQQCWVKEYAYLRFL